jgi:FtsH-binding integral membrane protein
MTSVSTTAPSLAARVRPDPGWTPRAQDRTACLVLLILLWFGIAAGFGLDLPSFLAENPPAPEIVHLHAVVFVGWMVFLTIQLLSIRSGHIARHRRWGAFGAGLVVLMLVLGPATAIAVDRQEWFFHHKQPNFLAVQLGDLFAFGTLVAFGLAFRKRPSTHKRLMLMATIALSAAGWARLEGALDHNHWPKSWVYDFPQLYYGSVILLAAVAAYDLATRRRLHPAFQAGATFILGWETLEALLWRSDAFTPIARRIVGV